MFQIEEKDIFTAVKIIPLGLTNLLEILTQLTALPSNSMVREYSEYSEPSIIQL